MVIITELYIILMVIYFTSDLFTVSGQNFEWPGSRGRGTEGTRHRHTHTPSLTHTLADEAHEEGGGWRERRRWLDSMALQTELRSSGESAKRGMKRRFLFWCYVLLFFLVGEGEVS